MFVTAVIESPRQGRPPRRLLSLPAAGAEHAAVLPLAAGVQLWAVEDIPAALGQAMWVRPAAAPGSDAGAGPRPTPPPGGRLHVQAAQPLRRQGVAIVQATIDHESRGAAIAPLCAGIGSGAREAVERTVCPWRCETGVFQGRRVVVLMTITVRFALN